VSSSEKISVILADDHPVFRQGLLRILESSGEFSIVGETGNGKEAIRLISDKQPDVAVLDISMPGLDGLAVVRETLKDESCMTEFVILTMYSEEVYFTEAMDLGVKGYLLKESATNDILECIRSVADGTPYVSPAVSQFLLRRRTRFRTQSRRASIDDLTTQEKRVLKLLSFNKTSKEIAAALSISIRTVQNHRSNICEKLSLQGYHKLLHFAIENKSFL